MVLSRCGNGERSKVEKVKDEIIGVLNFNAERADDGGGEVAKIHRHDDIHTAVDGRSQYMRVVWIGEV